MVLQLLVGIVFEHITYLNGNVIVVTKQNVRLAKVKADYGEAVLGTWQGRCTSEGSEFDDGQEHRWEYKNDGTFVYYVKNENNEWEPSTNTLNEYFVDGTLLCTRWVDDEGENREWWEISIDGNRMNWTALRKKTDGTTYTAKFEMEKVNLDDDNPVNDVYNYNAVDMGLSVKWADANLGATSPEGYGDYYAWGETEAKENYSWSTYQWGESSTSLTKYNTQGSYGTVDNITVLESADDVAYAMLGGKWRMPTISEVNELISTRSNESYKWEWKSVNGHSGWLVTYLVNNNSIFLPAAGYRIDSGLRYEGTMGGYWSSSLDSDHSDCAYCVILNPSTIGSGGMISRCCGYSIRPVWN